MSASARNEFEAALDADRRDNPELHLTPSSLALFLAYAKDASNWSGAPMIGGNVTSGVWGDERAQRGNLTQLKKAGLLTTDGQFIDFTEVGVTLAAKHGVEIR